jgi:hypothetical protein
MGKGMNHDDAKAVLFEVADVLEAARVPFFLLCGTALGAYREGDFIEGDGDIDLGMLMEDFRGRQRDVVAELDRRKFKVQVISKPWDFGRALKLEKDGIHVDLCGWMKHGDERFLSSSMKDYALVHNAAVIETMEPVELCGRMFRIPTPAKLYLIAEYGPDWRTPLPPDKRTGTFKSKNRVSGYLKSRGITPE